jgi:hypothetical protein
MNRLVWANKVVIGEAARVPTGEDSGLMARGWLTGGLTSFPFPRSFLLAMVALQKFMSEKIRAKSVTIFSLCLSSLSTVKVCVFCCISFSVRDHNHPSGLGPSLGQTWFLLKPGLAFRDWSKKGLG